MTDLRLATIWNVDTIQGHSLTIVHPDIPLDHEDDCHAAMERVGRMILSEDGTLTHVDPEGTTCVVDPDRVTIHVYTRPFDLRGTPFVPDMTTEVGRVRVRAVMEDPRYRSTEDEHVVVDISLEDLATIPGATGGLASIAVDTRRMVRRSGQQIPTPPVESR